MYLKLPLRTFYTNYNVYVTKYCSKYSLFILNEIYKYITYEDEDEGRVQRNVGEPAEVVERVLLRPCPDSNCQDAETQQL